MLENSLWKLKSADHKFQNKPDTRRVLNKLLSLYNLCFHGNKNQ
jgi:hypothetical protein